MCMYVCVQGLESFLQATSSIILGKDSPSLKEERVAVLQTLSGTGALRVAAEFISKFSDKKPKVYISDPSWGNHHTIFQKAGLETTKYRYSVNPRSRPISPMSTPRILIPAPCSTTRPGCGSCSHSHT